MEGVLQSRFWETNDGQKRSAIDVRAERVQFLGNYGPKEKEVEKAVDMQTAEATQQQHNSSNSSSNNDPTRPSSRKILPGMNKINLSKRR